MRNFRTISYYDAIQGKWEERYYIDSVEVDYLAFDNESDIEAILESKKLDEMIQDEVSEFDNDEKCECDSCEYRDVCDEYECEDDEEECECNGENEEDGFDQLVNYFVIDILESQGCPMCIKESLMEFYDVVSHGLVEALLGDEIDN